MTTAWTSTTAVGRRNVIVGGLALLTACTPKASTQSDPRTMLIKNGTVLSMAPNQPPRTADVLITGGRIAAIGPSIDSPSSATLIDAGGRFVMPGLIDMHAHVTFLPDGGESGGVVYDRQTSEAVLNRMLAFGVTTVRNPAAPPGRRR